MNDREILLVMTIVNLIKGSTPTAANVEKAYEDAVKKLERRDRGPVQAR